MEIPDTGAVFTLGQSHLSDDHQHYFFIRNDAIVTVNAGRNGQSAVICRSGRCFVWGTNEHGELGIGQTDRDIITKPTCIRDIKNLGYKITHMVFGKGFSVIATLDNRIFFCGRNILPTNFLCSLKESPHTHFSTPLSMTEDINSDLAEVTHLAAGASHFALISGGDKLLICGNFTETPPGDLKTFELNENFMPYILECGSTFTLLVAGNDISTVYIVGHFGGKTYVELTQLRDFHPECRITSIHISPRDEIFLLTGEDFLYKCSQLRELFFERITLAPNGEKMQYLTTGTDAMSFLTDDQRFFTTMASPREMRREENFRELTKFKPMDVLQISSGLHHMLIRAVKNEKKAFVTRQRIPNALTNGNTDHNLNNLNKTFTKIDSKDFVNNINGTAVNGVNGDGQEATTKDIPRPEGTTSTDCISEDSNSSRKSSVSSAKQPKKSPENRKKSRELKVEQELARDENMKVVKILDPIEGEIYQCIRNNGEAVENFIASEKHKASIRFYDNGIDKTRAEHQRKGSIVDTVLGERLEDRSLRKMADVKDETMEYLKGMVDGLKSETRRKTPIPEKEETPSKEAEDEDEQTTASLNSKTDGDDPKSPDEKPQGFMKQVLRDLRNAKKEFSCKNADAIEEASKDSEEIREITKSKGNTKSEFCSIL
ncbi:uncharacterized protein LOC129791704 isoform X2 [Lutzomyia longipalpis]|uniref:uncharacterized protein LOC129791704 isoform X2 n=1 Tax=Lutzomyia longipalpis TaxID=7200 RepID=UPI0024837AB2|nr:uncharacterized protein LOC129791704 isoform X2 [Lutzomyia longipalpis]